MPRTTGTYATTTTLGESVRAFVPRPLPPADPPLAPTCFVDLNRQAELALARLACVFRRSVTDRFGIVTAEFGSVTEHFGDVTDGRLVPA